MPYPYGTQNAPAVGNGLGGLPRRSSATTNGAAGAWQAVGAPVTVSEANYIGGFRNNIAVDRSTGQVMLMENNSAGTSLSATIYQITASGITTVATGTSTNSQWTDTCKAGADRALRRVIGAKGTFWLNSTSAYSATVSGGTITFGTSSLSIPSSTPKAGGGTLGSTPGFQKGSMAASEDGRLFGYFAGAIAPVIEIDPITRSAILASNNAPNSSTAYNNAVVAFGRYIKISDYDTASVFTTTTSLDLLTHTEQTLSKVGQQYNPSSTLGWGFVIDPIDQNTYSFNSCYSYSNGTAPTITDSVNIPTVMNAFRYSSATSYSIIGDVKGGTRESRYSYGDMLFEYSSSSLGWGLQERRFLVGDLPSQRSSSGATDNTIAFSVSQNLAVVIIGTSMQAYAR